MPKVKCVFSPSMPKWKVVEMDGSISPTEEFEKNIVKKGIDILKREQLDFFGSSFFDKGDFEKIKGYKQIVFSHVLCESATTPTNFESTAIMIGRSGKKYQIKDGEVFISSLPRKVPKNIKITMEKIKLGSLSSTSKIRLCFDAFEPETPLADLLDKNIRQDILDNLKVPFRGVKFETSDITAFLADAQGWKKIAIIPFPIRAIDITKHPENPFVYRDYGTCVSFLLIALNDNYEKIDSRDKQALLSATPWPPNWKYD